MRVCEMQYCLLRRMLFSQNFFILNMMRNGKMEIEYSICQDQVAFLYIFLRLQEFTIFPLYRDGNARTTGHYV